VRARLAGGRLQGDRMSASSPPGMPTLRRGEVKGAADAFWLASKEVRRTWLSYPLSVLCFLFLGFFVVPSVSGVFEFEGFGAGGRRMEHFYNAFFFDYLFLVICAFLGANAISRDYTLGWRDPFASRLLFFRSLPITVESLVGSRALYMLLALLLNAPAFFLPAFFLSGFGKLGTSYLWFCGIWIGYCLLASGLWLLCELTVSGRVYARIYFGFAAVLTPFLALSELTLELSLVGRTAEVAQSSFGALAAIASILAGAVAFALLSRPTVRRLKKRDFSE
jgi:hypothetical protein